MAGVVYTTNIANQYSHYINQYLNYVYDSQEHTLVERCLEQLGSSCRGGVCRGGACLGGWSYQRQSSCSRGGARIWSFEGAGRSSGGGAKRRSRQMFSRRSNPVLLCLLLHLIFLFTLMTVRIRIRRLGTCMLACINCKKVSLKL